jgi:hypothetical protein
MRAARLSLGAPGIYRHPESEPPVPGGARMDVCAFLGVATRGPVREPILDEAWRFDRPCVEADRPRRRSVAVAVESFGEYRRLFGGFEGPGRLPFAVASFFEQGGRRAYIVRIVHEYGNRADNAAGVATGVLTGSSPSIGTFSLSARSEGTWGNRLRAALGYAVAPLAFEDSSTVTELHLSPNEKLCSGVLLRLRLPAGPPEMRFVSDLRRLPRPDGPGERLHAVLDRPLAAPPEAAEIVTGILEVEDGVGQRERHTGLGLSRQHERWLGTSLCYESELVYPDPSWVDGDLVPDEPRSLPLEPRLPSPEAPQFSGGVDRHAQIVTQDLFDPRWTPGDAEPGDGVHALTLLPDLSSVVAPDLYSHELLPSRDRVVDPPSLVGPDFEPCVDAPSPAEQENPQPDMPGLHLEPTDPSDFKEIVRLQAELVRLAERLRNFVVLLDVPAGLSHRQVLRWRSHFASSYAAAYHPWLKVARLDDSRDALVPVNPSAVAAGVIARQELQFGVPHGPANVVAKTAVDVDQAISPERHDEVHPLGINVYLRERDGVLLTAGRTLSLDPGYRQLSVRRLMLMLRRVLSQQTHWMVFESNGPDLRATLRHLLRGYLRQLFLAGAFKGATEEEAFFVRCDEVLNPRRVVDAGQLIAEIGVAPAEPTEFIVLRLTRNGDGTLTVQE